MLAALVSTRASLNGVLRCLHVPTVMSEARHLLGNLNWPVAGRRIFPSRSVAARAEQKLPVGKRFAVERLPKPMGMVLGETPAQTGMLGLVLLHVVSNSSCSLHCVLEHVHEASHAGLSES